MRFNGIHQEHFRANWSLVSSQFDFRLNVPVGSKIIGLSLDKMELYGPHYDKQDVQDMWVSVMWSEADEHGIDIRVFNGGTHIDIDDTEWEYVCSGQRKTQIVHLFRKIVG